MNNYVNIPNLTAPVALGSHALKFCLPTKIDCNPTCNTFVKDCEELNNCNLCKIDDCYFIPFSGSQTFDFQLRVIDEYNDNAEQPTSGWGDFVIATLCDKDGNSVEGDFTTFAPEYVVGFDGQHSYQTIRIDLGAALALSPTDCFSFKFESFDSNNVSTQEFCSEPFTKISDCKKLICLEGKYDKTDCCNNYYGEAVNNTAWVGTSNFKYSNKICVLGRLEKDDSTVEITEFGTKRSRTERRYNSSLRLAQKIPCYMQEHIANIFDAPSSCIDDVEYSNDGFNVENRVTQGDYYLWDFGVYQTCEKDFLCEE